MICPYCGSDQSRCIESRQHADCRRRRYECYACNQRYSTKEVAVISCESEAVPMLDTVTKILKRVERVLDKREARKRG